MTSQYHQPDYGNRASVQEPLRYRFPEWFGVHRLAERLERNRKRRNAKWGRREWTKGSSPHLLGVTHRDRFMIARSFNGR